MSFDQSKMKMKILREISLVPEFSLKLVQGDITQAPVDAIINPANSSLNHGGGLAELISKKAGPTLQQESAAWIDEHGPVSHEFPAYTSAGDLPYQYIIHAVGPVWGSGEEQNKLRVAVHGSLALANELNIKTVALPAISTGVFRFPLELAAGVILGAILDFVKSTSALQLESTLLVLFGDNAATGFTKIWDQTIK